MKWRKSKPADDILDDERSWQGDDDPYLARLAHEGHLGKPAPRKAERRVAGPADDGDPYLVQLARSCRGEQAG